MKDTEFEFYVRYVTKTLYSRNPQLYEEEKDDFTWDFLLRIIRLKQQYWIERIRSKRLKETFYYTYRSYIYKRSREKVVYENQLSYTNQDWDDFNLLDSVSNEATDLSITNQNLDIYFIYKRLEGISKVWLEIVKLLQESYKPREIRELLSITIDKYNYHFKKVKDHLQNFILVSN